MSYDFYKLVHFLGLFMLFSGLGGRFVQALNRQDPQTQPGRRWIGILHGVGLLLLLVAGFGMLAKGQIPIQGWVITKLGIWLVLGAIGALAMRKSKFAGVFWVVTLLLGVSAAFLARYKPF